MDCYQILDLTISGCAALGTIAASITALYLACRQDKINLKVSVYRAVTIGMAKPCPESVAIRIINRSRFSVQINQIGWAVSDARIMLHPDYVYSNGCKGSKIPFLIQSGEESPLFSIPWNEFEDTLRYIKSNDDGVYRHDVLKKRIKFYVSTPRSDKDIFFDIDQKIMDAFVKSINEK